MRLTPLPAALAGRAFSLAEADAEGVGRERLRRIDLAAPTRGIRWPAQDPPKNVERIRAYRSLLRPGQFISHVSAALLWQLPVPRNGPTRSKLHVTSIAPQNAMKRPEVVGHTVRPELASTQQRWDMPTSSPPTTWVECGMLLTIDELIALGDAIVTRPELMTSIDDLRQALDRRRGCRGAKRLRAALPQIRVGSGSAKETELRLIIVRAGFPEPRLQVPIFNEYGHQVGRVDMAYPDQRLILEYEGDQHRTDDSQWAKDIRRYRDFERLGWFTFRLTKRDLDDNVDETLEVLAECLSRRGSGPALVPT